MNNADLDRILTSLIDELAAIEHERWSHWQRNVHAKCHRQADGSLVIPAEHAARWERQIAAPYADLDEEEKEADREQVRRYLPTIAKALSSRA